MALFELERASALPVTEAWRRITDWPRHAGAAPLTTITVTTPPPTGVGTAFVARTGVGPATFDDPMEVVGWRPPEGDDGAGWCRLEKRGSLLTGWSEIEVRPRPGRPGSSIRWRGELRVAPLPGPVDRATAPAGRIFYGRLLSGLLGR